MCLDYLELAFSCQIQDFANKIKLSHLLLVLHAESWTKTYGGTVNFLIVHQEVTAAKGNRSKVTISFVAPLWQQN